MCVNYSTHLSQRNPLCFFLRISRSIHFWYSVCTVIGFSLDFLQERKIKRRRMIDTTKKTCSTFQLSTIQDRSAKNLPILTTLNRTFENGDFKMNEETPHKLFKTYAPAAYITFWSLYIPSDVSQTSSAYKRRYQWSKLKCTVNRSICQLSRVIGRNPRNLVIYLKDLFKVDIFEYFIYYKASPPNPSCHIVESNINHTTFSAA